jgi:hypothetical protein
MALLGALRRTAALFDGRVRFSRPKRRFSRTQKENRRKFLRFVQRNAEVIRQGESRLAELWKESHALALDDAGAVRSSAVSEVEK